MGTVVPLIPPPQYDVVPPVPMIEQVLSQEEIQKVCMALYPGVKLEPGEFIRGCTQRRVMMDVGELRNPVQNQGPWPPSAAPFRFITVCKVWRIDDELVRRHENAHCNLWPADHPGGR